VPIRAYLESDEAGPVLNGKPFAIYVVCRRYWSINMKGVRKLAKKKGGEYVDNLHFVYAGRQIRSFLALISYLTYGENREKYAGIKIPPTNLQPGYEEQARADVSAVRGDLAELVHQGDEPGIQLRDVGRLLEGHAVALGAAPQPEPAAGAGLGYVQRRHPPVGHARFFPRARPA
jgi:hypothetical protein